MVILKTKVANSGNNQQLTMSNDVGLLAGNGTG
jgi:hypothetical protein